MTFVIYDPDTRNEVGPFPTREHAEVFLRDQLGHRPKAVIEERPEDCACGDGCCSLN